MNTKMHKFLYALILPLLKLFLKLKFGFRYDKPRNLPENYIVLSNHTTDYDAIFLAVGMKRHMYFVASEHISRWKYFSLFKTFIDPITRRKGSVAASTVTEIMRRIRKGNNVCVFASGTRSWDGVTFPILPSTGKMVKSAGCGLVTYRLVGGYFVSPIWSEGSGTRRGYVKGSPVRIFTKEQIAAMSVDEINAVINEDLYENAYERQLADPKKYSGRNLAEHLENLLFVCPECGGYDTFKSKGSRVTCGSCGLSFTYDKYGMLHGVDFKTVYDFSQWQRGRVAEDAAGNVPYRSAHAVLSCVGVEEETFVDEGELCIDRDTLSCGSTVIPMEEVTNLDIHGKHSICFTANKNYYELKIDKGCNAFKYVLLFGELKNTSKQEKVR